MIRRPPRSTLFPYPPHFRSFFFLCAASSVIMEVRNIKVENSSSTSILVRVSYQKSAITSQNFKQFSKLMTSSVKSNEKGGNIGLGIPGYANFNVKLNKHQANAEANLDERFDSTQIEMIVSPFLDEGWIAIKPQKSKKFGVQGKIAWVSVVDGDGRLIVPGWNTTGHSFVYDGDDFDEVEEIEPTDIATQAAPVVQPEITLTTKQDDHDQDKGDKPPELTDESQITETIWSDIWTNPDKYCCDEEQQRACFPYWYYFFCLGIPHFVWDCMWCGLGCCFALCCGPCYLREIVGQYKKAVLCTLHPMYMEYRVSNKCCMCNGVPFYMVTTPIHALVAFFHCALMVATFGVSFGALYPISKIHWHLAKIFLAPWQYEIRRKQ
eukprot:34243_1